MEKYAINVTQADIDAGVKQECFRCPIALAARRVFDHDVSVDDEYIIHYASTEVKADFYALPDEARQFVQHFDHGDPVTPFSFEVSLDVD